MSNYTYHKNRFVEIDKQNIFEVKSFCFINELLEKVVVDKVTNPDEFLNGSEPILKELTIEFPNIHPAFNLVILSKGIDKRDFQCSK
ncbi:hypothetical protein C3B47_14480 [Flavobacterium columnare]|uniref:hypothetical protein n=1 Tax=Flavobacterium columnare TaxID=996 RepID=UPI001896604C|nr:hypothetical protein [Flavobacterium columnare]MBF6654059.1 hypothetical protein [Flavobacterium columnare]MBF6657387.1 hypothetical protein [Flavobacterium columnare]